MALESTTTDDIFFGLDGVSSVGAWWADLSWALLEVERRLPPDDIAALTPLAVYLNQHRRLLREQASPQKITKAPSFSHETHPVATALMAFRYRCDHGLDAPGVERLLAVAVCAALEAEADLPKRRLARLCSMLRGALESKSSKLLGVLAKADTLSSLIRVLGDLPAESGLPKQFMPLWNGWLRHALARWMLNEPERLRHALESPALRPDLTAPTLPITSPMATEADAAIELDCLTTAPEWDGEEAPSTTARVSRARADGLVRASEGNLHSPPDFWVPDELVEQLCRNASQAAKHAVRGGDRGAAEPFVALMLVVAGSIRELGLHDVVWGSKAGPQAYAIDPERPVLYRPIRRPVNAVVPSPELQPWLEASADDIAWPLPPSLHALLRALAPAGGVRVGDPVLPGLARSIRAPYRLRDLISQLVPLMQIGALPIRQAMASTLARTLGPEVAQLALGDSFSLTIAPAYYSALPESAITAPVAKAQARWFDEKPAAVLDRGGLVGSRLVLKDESAKAWPDRLRKVIHVAARQSDLATKWRAYRDHLAAVLCVVTGHRPEDSLGRIDLHDVIPEYALVILRDKQVDALRMTRVAATGRRWVSDLRIYLDFLADVADAHPATPIGTLANAVLRGESPLFSVPAPDGSALSMTAADLRISMPEAFQKVTNFYRHRLNQYLQRRQVDPELRHAQLGWVVSPAHAMADLSPLSPKGIGSILGPFLDEMLVEDGWYPKTQRITRWHWDRVPMPALKDWRAEMEAAKAQHEVDVRQVQAQLYEQGEKVETKVLRRLAAAVTEFLPRLRVDLAAKQLVAAGEGLGPEEATPIVTADHHALICDRVRVGDEDPTSALEAVVTRLLLYRLVRSARSRGVIEGPIPSRPYLGVTAELSPFLPGLGLAVRHAHAIRSAMLLRLKLHKVRERGPLTVLSILAFSAYRNVEVALAATGAAAKGVRSRLPGDVLRVPAKVGKQETPLAFRGVPAVLLARRAKEASTAREPDIEQLDAWVREKLLTGFAWPAPGGALAALADTLCAAAPIELSGIERTLLQEGGTPAAVPSQRCVECDDDWPVRTADANHSLDEAGVPTYAADEDKTPVIPKEPRQRVAGYRELTGLLNPHVFRARRAAQKSRQGQVASDGKTNWRQDLTKALHELSDRVGGETNLGLLAGYALNHLQYTSEDGGKLSHGSLHREVTGFAGDLLALLGARSILTLDAATLQATYLAVLMGKGPRARPYAFEELWRFQRYLHRTHRAPEIAKAELAALVGTRDAKPEAGLLTDREIRQVLHQLEQDLDAETERKDANAEARRLCELRKLMFLILEASGIRPGSAHGLTVGDVCLLGEGRDFVHVHRTGEYGQAKTDASIGFIPLEGSLWSEHRAWVLQWIQDERKLIGDEDGWKKPLFSTAPGARRRFSPDFLTRRFDALLKWASRQPDASTYWLRKTRVTARFRETFGRTTALARDVYAVLCACGHARFSVPQKSYIGDPAVLMYADAHDARDLERALLLAATDLPEAILDMAWHRGKQREQARIRIALDRLAIPCPAPEPERVTPAPELRRQGRLMPHHIEGFARAMQQYRDRQEALLRSGITLAQAEQLEAAALELLSQKGKIPWGVPGLRHPRMVMVPARRLSGVEGLFDLLDAEPDKDLIRIAKVWAHQGHLRHLHGSEVLLQLKGQEEVDACRRLLAITKLDLKLALLEREKLLTIGEKDTQQKAHGTAFCWVLATVWIYHRIMQGPPESESVIAG